MRRLSSPHPLLAVLIGCIVPTISLGQDPEADAPPIVSSVEEEFQFQDGELVNYLNLPPGYDQLPEITPSIPDAPVPSPLERVFTPAAPAPGESRGAETLGSGEIPRTATTNTAALLQESPEIQTVNVQRRSNIDFDPRIRGYRDGQILSYTGGAYVTPVRPDLDSMLGRVDPQWVTGIDVYSGPYTSRLGPGFSFIDVHLAPTMRSQNGCVTNSRAGYTYRGNGSQHYGVASMWGGDADTGHLVNYTYRNGDDYRAGDGSRLPGAYLLHNLTGQYGVNLAQDTKFEVRYDYQNQTDTTIPGQFFKIDKAETQAVELSLIDEDPAAMWTQMRTDVWFNRTGLRGGLFNDPYFQVANRVESALNARFPGSGTSTLFADTSAGLKSTGGRVEFLFGDPEESNLIVGSDLRHLRQFIREDYRIDFTAGAPIAFSQHLFPSEMFNPGVYTELETPLLSWWTTRIGGRADYVHTTATITDPNSNIDPNFRKQDDAPYSLFATSEMQLTDSWQGIVKAGQAQRVPTLLERYSSGLVLARLQSGFNRVIGNADLGPERLWQIDASLVGDYDDLQLRVTGFHGWIQDYVTYAGNNVADPTGAKLVRHFATPLATLSGYEARADLVLSDSWSTFVASHFVYGQDQTISQPLPGISPLEGQIGLRWQDWEDPDYMGVETLIRVVDSQQRVAFIREGVFFNPTGITQAEQPTSAFTTVNVRGYYNPRENVRIVGGIENLLDATYLQHLDLRLDGPARFAYAPGFTPYMGIDVSF